MQPTDDGVLLRQYAENHSDEAFAALVARHVNLVYSVAVRCVGDPHQAEEVAQVVFILLARKAQLRHDKALSSWLFQTTRLTASNFVRSETRRHRRELEAHMRSVLNDPGNDLWPRIAPMLDDAVAELNETDRHAILLRFYEGRNLREVGAALGASEDAAEKRVSRAVEKLRAIFAKRGVTVGTSGLVVVISANAVQAAPVGLAVAISTAAALAGTAIVTTATATAIKAVTMTALQKTLIAGLTALVAVTVGLRLYKTANERALRMASNAEPTPQAAEEGASRMSEQPTQVSAGAAIVPVEVPQSPTALDWYRRGDAYRSEQKYDEALAAYTKAIELIEQRLPPEPWFEHVYFARACLYDGNQVEAKRDYAKAIADYTKALELAPKLYSPRFNRALNYTHLRQFDNAVADYSTLIEDSDTDFSRNGNGRTNCLSRAYEYRGRAYHDSGKDHAKAIADYDAALFFEPARDDETSIQWRRGLCYRALQQNDKAMDVATLLSERALKWATAPGDSDADRDSAHTSARWASEIFEHKQPYQLEVLAAVEAKAGRFSEAVQDQKRALALLTAETAQHRPAMQARLELYQAGKTLRAE